MSVPIPTVDQFSETTVLGVIRKIVDYLRNDLITDINDNDIISGTFSLSGNDLSCTLTKGDGTTINIPAITLPGGGTATNPYPTSFSANITGDGATMNFTLGLSNSTNVTGTCDLSALASASDLSDIQEQISGLTLTSSGNEMSINGTNASIVNSIGGSVSDNNLTINVNGVSSSAIPLPSSGGGFNVPTNLGTVYRDYNDVVSRLNEIADGSYVTVNYGLVADSVQYYAIMTGIKTTQEGTSVINGFGVIGNRTTAQYNNTYGLYKIEFSTINMLNRYMNSNGPTSINIKRSSISSIGAYVITS